MASQASVPEPRPLHIWLGDPGPTRLGRQAREALAGHQLWPLEQPLDNPDLMLLFPAQLGQLPRNLPRVPCPTVLFVPDRERARVASSLPVDAIRAVPVGYDPELHYPLDEPQFERDFGHPGPPPDDLRLLCQGAELSTAQFQAGLDEIQKADFLRRTRITLTHDPELTSQALACGSLPLSRIEARFLHDEPARRAEVARRQSSNQTWRQAWEQALQDLPARSRRVSPCWWERQVYCSERRTNLEKACAALRPTTPRRANLLGCLLATRADFEPDEERQGALRDEARACFEKAFGLGRMAYLNLAQLHLRRHQPEEAVTLLTEVVQEDQAFVPIEFYPRVGNQFRLRWQRYPTQRERLVLWKAWLLLAEHCPPFAHRMARQAIRALAQPAEGYWQLALRMRAKPKAQLRLLRKVLARAPLKLEARYVLIRTLWERGDKLAAAREHQATRRTLQAFPYLEREPRELERLWVETTALEPLIRPR
jgi:tetratricopeptide (TPR) repeat protein